MKEQLQQLLQKWEGEFELIKKDFHDAIDGDDKGKEGLCEGSYNTKLNCIRELKAIIEQTQP